LLLFISYDSLMPLFAILNPSLEGVKNARTIVPNGYELRSQ
jgi:hypothetical protein